MDYDVSMSDGRLGDSFDLQNTHGVCYAVIKFRDKPGNALYTIDVLNIGHVGLNGSPLDLVAQVYSPASVTGVQSYALDSTGLNLLSQQTGYSGPKTPEESTLDLYVEDDTRVDFFRNYVWYGPSCKQAGTC